MLYRKIIKCLGFVTLSLGSIYQFLCQTCSNRNCLIIGIYICNNTCIRIYVERNIFNTFKRQIGNILTIQRVCSLNRYTCPLQRLRSDLISQISCQGLSYTVVIRIGNNSSCSSVNTCIGNVELLSGKVLNIGQIRCTYTGSGTGDHIADIRYICILKNRLVFIGIGVSHCNTILVYSGR